MDSDHEDPLEAELANHERSTLSALIGEESGLIDSIISSLPDEQLTDWIKWQFLGEDPQEGQAAELTQELSGHDRETLLALIGEEPDLKDSIIDSLSDEGMREWIKWHYKNEGQGDDEPESTEIKHNEVDLERANNIENSVNLSEEHKSLIRDVEAELGLPDRLLTSFGADVDIKGLLHNWDSLGKIDSSMIDGIINRMSRSLAYINDMEPSANKYDQIDKSAPNYEEGTREKWLEALNNLFNKLIPGEDIELNIPERGQKFNPRNHKALRGKSATEHGLNYHDIISTARLGVSSKGKVLEKPSVVVAN